MGRYNPSLATENWMDYLTRCSSGWCMQCLHWHRIRYRWTTKQIIRYAHLDNYWPPNNFGIHYPMSNSTRTLLYTYPRELHIRLDNIRIITTITITTTIITFFCACYYVFSLVIIIASICWIHICLNAFPDFFHTKHEVYCCANCAKQ